MDSQFKKANFLQTPIDFFIAARMEDLKVEPNEKAKSDVLARRLAFDVTGLPPRQPLFDAYIQKEITYENYLDSLLAQSSFV